MNADFSTPSGRAPHAGTLFAVDDDENERLHFLRAVGDTMLPHRCRVFSCGEDLLDALIDVLRGAPAPIACFVDVKMGGMSGLDVLRWIRAQPGLHAIPVIMLSASDDPRFLNEALHVGAQCYIAKFPAPQVLREVIAAAERFSTEASCHGAFSLPCNLLTTVRESIAHR